MLFSASTKACTSQAVMLASFVGLLTLCCLPQPINAAITPTGDVTPTYNNEDPWLITSSTLMVGNAGQGSLLIDNGSTVNSWYTYIGYLTGSDGDVTVTGSGSQLTIFSTLSIGHYGNGVFNILDNASVSSARGYIGYTKDSVGSVYISGSASQWDMSNDLYVGHYGSGTLTIENGAIVNNGFGAIGYGSGDIPPRLVAGQSDLVANPDTDGSGIVDTVTVTGSGSQWNNAGELSIGRTDDAQLHIVNGAAVSVGGNTWVGPLIPTQSFIQFDTGTLTTNGLAAGFDQLRGNGTIYTSTLFSDIDLVYDQTHGYQQQYILNSLPGQNITVNTDVSISDNNGVLGAGYQGTGSLTIADGMSVESLVGHIGYKAGSNGTATITGQGSTWRSTGSLYAGYGGTGSLLLENGGVLQVASVYLGHQAGADGTMTVSGSDSLWNNNGGDIFVGYYGTGTLNILNGAVVNDLDDIYIGRRSDSSGVVNVDGSNSHISADTIDIGGPGELNISNGAVVSNHQSMIYDNSSVTIKDTGSEWNLSGTIYIGNNGIATITIQNGGLLTSSDCIIGVGEATIDGTDSRWEVDGNFIIGDSATATFNHNGVTIQVSNGNMTLANSDTANGIYNLNAGTLDLNGNQILVGTGATHEFNFTGGTLKNASTINLQQPFIQQGGTLAPGGSIGETNIIGDYDFVTGTIELEFGGPDNPHDLLTATGNIDIALTDTTLGLLPLGYMQAGTYTLIESTSGNITGFFEHITGLAEYTGLVDIIYETSAIKITLNHDFVPGDLNADGFVGLDDIDILLANWNHTVPVADLASGDYSRDGFVGLDDLDAVLLNWNQGSPPANIMQMIPEPGTSTLCGISLLVCFNRKSRRNKAW